MLDTYFAPAQKANKKQIFQEIVSNSPIMSGLLNSVGGLLAILNEYRQIIAVNDSFLKNLDINDPELILGMRPGETLKCIHSHKEPSGCGTTKFCSSCGAAIAIVASLGQDKPVERVCALTAHRDNKKIDLAFLVRSQPILIDKSKFLLLFFQDITDIQKKAALERTFFHDISNMLTMLSGASELLVSENPSSLAETIYKTSRRLNKEIEIQRFLSQSEPNDYQPINDKTSTHQILSDLKSFFTSHPAAHDKYIDFQKNPPKTFLTIDTSLLSRILCNMVINALEATSKNEIVKVWLEHDTDQVSFCVWNDKEMPQNIKKRIFQRNFSTKEGAGRGTGTFSMKLFGEKILGGQIKYSTSENEGTIFRFSYPCQK